MRRLSLSTAFLAGFIFALSATLSAPKATAMDRSFSKLSIILDKSSGDVKVKGLKSPNNLEELLDKRFVHLDLKVLLDGKDADAVLTSTEESDRRYDIDCRKGNLGSLIMAQGVEYYLTTNYQGQLIRVSIYPGTRIEHIYNDAACVFDRKFPDKAVFHIRGFYVVVSNQLEDGISFQLRPVKPSVTEADKAQKK